MILPDGFPDVPYKIRWYLPGQHLPKSAWWNWSFDWSLNQQYEFFDDHFKKRLKPVASSGLLRAYEKHEQLAWGWWWEWPLGVSNCRCDHKTIKWLVGLKSKGCTSCSCLVEAPTMVSPMSLIAGARFRSLTTKLSIFDLYFTNILSIKRLIISFWIAYMCVFYQPLCSWI